MHYVSVFTALFMALSSSLYSGERPRDARFAGTLTHRAYYPRADAAGGWRTGTNAAQAREAAGIDLARLEQAWEFTQRCTQNGGLLVVRNGWLVFEKYFGRASRNANPDMASTGKAYTSIACGIMLKEFSDKIPNGLDTKVFTPDLLPEAFSSDGKLDDPRRGDITLGQLLCMTGGYTGEGGAPTAVVMGRAFPLKAVPGQNIRDLDTSSLHCLMWTNAGAGYSYSSPEPHIGSMVLRRVTGMDLQDYINERLAKPMGWGPWGYCLHRDGFTMPHANGAGRFAIRLLFAPRRQVGQQTTRAGGLHCAVQQDVALQSALSLHADVRAKRGWPRRGGAARLLLEIGRGRLHPYRCAIAGSGDLQAGRQQRAIRSGPHRFAPARAES